MPDFQKSNLINNCIDTSCKHTIDECCICAKSSIFLNHKKDKRLTCLILGYQISSRHFFICRLYLCLVNPFTAIGDYSRQRKQCSPSWDCTIFRNIQPNISGLQIFLINSILCFQKASMILNVKVVPNNIFKFGGERVNCMDIY